MATLQILTPPVTPGHHEIHAKTKHRTHYRRIRFKNWQPEQPATKVSENTQDDKKPESKSASSSFNQAEDEEPITETQFDALLRRAIASHPASPLTPTPSNGTRMDPFMQLPIKADGIVPATLDYFLSICAPVSKEGFTVHGHENPHMTLLFPFMMQNALLFESIIALCRASILICVGKPATSDRALVHHRMKAITGVAESLSTNDATNDAVLLTVAMLLTLEIQDSWIIRNRRAPEISVDSHGYIHETFAGLSLDKPIDYPSLPFPPELCTVLSRLPPGFSELALSGKLSSQTMHVLASLSATTVSSESEGFDDTRLDAEIQAMLSALQRLSLMKISSNERYLTCGLVAYCFQLRRLRPLNLFHDPSLRAFIRLIPHQEKPDSIREQHCMIWISMAVAGALSLRTIRMPGTHLVLDRVFELYPSMSKWETMEATLKIFFGTANILKHWRKCHVSAVFRWKQISKRTNEQPLVALTDPTDMPPEEEDIQDIDFELLKLHARGAPGSMIHMMGAAQCPFRSRMKSLQPTSPMASPHG